MVLSKSNTQLKIPVFSPIFNNMKKAFEFFINNILKERGDSKAYIPIDDFTV